MEISVTVVPSSVGVESRQTGYPFVIAIIYPSGSHRQFTVCSKSCHIQNTESHLPYMNVGKTVFQMINIFMIKLMGVFADRFEKQLFLGRR